MWEPNAVYSGGFVDCFGEVVSAVDRLLPSLFHTSLFFDESSDSGVDPLLMLV